MSSQTFSGDSLAESRNQLLSLGKTILPVKIGSHEGRLFLQSSKVWAPDPENKPQELLIAYEGGGCMVYDGKEPLNAFKLISAGFNIFVAGEVCGLLNSLFQFGSHALPPSNPTINPSVIPIHESSVSPARPRRSRKLPRARLRPVARMVANRR